MATALALVLLAAGCSSSSDQSRTQKHDAHQNDGAEKKAAAANPTPRIPDYYPNPEDAKPFPKVLDAAQFTTPAVAKAYRYAAENPALFAQQPCYCYCDTGYQHRSLLDCYATDHSAG